MQDLDDEPCPDVHDLQDTDSDVGEADFDESCLPGLDDEGLSVAGTSGTRGVKRLRVHGSWFPDGPVTLNEVLCTLPARVREAIRNAEALGQKGARKELTGTLHADMVLTSSYSGLGTFEQVGTEVHKHMRNELGVGDGRLICYSATENSKNAQHALLYASRETGPPWHVFRDILGRLQNTDRNDLINLQNHRLQDFKQVKTELQLGAITKEEYQANRQRMGEDMLKEMMEVLGKVEFNDCGVCMVHQQMCHISPRDVTDLEDAYWVEAAGNTCCPWSPMSPGDGWLSKDTLPFLVWAYSTRFFEPDTVLEENVINFQHEQLHSILAENGPGVLKSTSTRPMNIEEAPPHYQMQALVFSPTDLGIPSERWRKYTAFHLYPWVCSNFCVPFESLFFRQLLANGNIYLDCIPDSAKQRELQGMLQAKSPPVPVPPRHLDADDGMTASEFQRVEDALLMAQEQGFCGEDLDHFQTPMFLYDASQRPQWWKRFNTSSFPAVLRKTLLYNAIDKELAPVASHWLAQGFPHPVVTSISEDIMAAFPFSADLLNPLHEDGLSVADQRTLTGNAMHRSAIGCWFIYNLLGTDRSLMRKRLLAAASASKNIAVEDSD